MRQRNACVRTRTPGYHLNGTLRSSASCPRARSSSTSWSVKISTPPRANGTCGRHTAILILAPLDAPGSRPLMVPRPPGSAQHPVLRGPCSPLSSAPPQEHEEVSCGSRVAQRLELGFEAIDLLLKIVDQPKRGCV